MSNDCNLCHKHPASQLSAGFGWVCRKCHLEERLAAAKNAAAIVPTLEAELAALGDVIVVDFTKANACPRCKSDAHTKRLRRKTVRGVVVADECELCGMIQSVTSSDGTDGPEGLRRVIDQIPYAS